MPRNGDRDQPAGLTEVMHDGGEWLTEEGDVVIDAEGRTVFITESVDDLTSAKLRNRVFDRSQAAYLPKGLEYSQVAPLYSSVLSAVNAFLLLAPPSPMARNDRPSPLR
jgi:predicted GTPase